jgi:hypothetical protein
VAPPPDAVHSHGAQSRTWISHLFPNYEALERVSLSLHAGRGRRDTDAVAVVCVRTYGYVPPPAAFVACLLLATDIRQLRHRAEHGAQVSRADATLCVVLKSDPIKGNGVVSVSVARADSSDVRVGMHLLFVSGVSLHRRSRSHSHSL